MPPSSWSRRLVLALPLALLPACRDATRAEPDGLGLSPLPDADRARERAHLVLIPTAVESGSGCRVLLRRALLGSAVDEIPDGIDPCVVRVGGEQRTLAPTLEDGVAGLDVPFPLTTDALVGMSVPATATTPSLHVKAIVLVRDSEGQALPSTAVAQRIGLRAELTPLLDPCTLATGDDLPVRLAVDLGARARVPVVVEHVSEAEPSATQTMTVTTDEGGLSLVKILGAGSYVVSAEVMLGTLDGGQEAGVATLGFVIADQSRGAQRGGRR